MKFLFGWIQRIFRKKFPWRLSHWGNWCVSINKHWGAQIDSAHGYWIAEIHSNDILFTVRRSCFDTPDEAKRWVEKNFDDLRKISELEY